jgi:hypothetical protein
MSKTIGSPSRHQTRGEPDVAVGRHQAPPAEAVEIGIAGHVARNIAGRYHGFFTPVAIHAKRVELIGRPQRMWSFENGGRVGASRPRHHTQMKSRRLVAHVDLGIARANRGNGRVASRRHVDPVIAIAQQRKGELRRVDLESFGRSQRMEPDLNRSRGDFNLRHRVVQVQEREIGAARQANRSIVGLQLDQPISLGPDMIAQHDRMIELGGSPIFDAGGLKRNSSGEITKARDPAGRRGVILRERRKNSKGTEG